MHEPIPYNWPVVAEAGPDRGETGPDVRALLEGWDTSGHGSLARRLAHALRHVIDAGVLPDGWRLPPERVLAEDLAVGRTTITAALDELRAERRVVSRQGSGTFVVSPAQPVPFGTRIAEHLASGPGIDLAKGDAPDLSHLPPVTLDMAQLNATCGGAAVNVAGLPAMREAIARLYKRGGMTGAARVTLPEEIHITAGSHQATALLLPILAGRGGSVAVPECTYAGIFDILDASGLRALPIRMDRAGILPESLDEGLRARPAAAYIQAGPQIPTGRVTPPGRVRAIAATLDLHGTTVIEDTTVTAVTFGGPVSFLADQCRTATVITTGSLSKTCWSGLRIGWLRAPASTVDASIYRHLASDLGASAPSQLLALQLLPHLDDIAHQRRRRIEAAVGAALDQLERSIPEATIDPPDGNSVLWLELPIEDSAALVQVGRRNGVRVAPGSIHFSDKQPGPFVRIDVDRPAPVVDEGIRRLARSWRELRTG